MRFVKMHGCGNDYVYLDAITDAAILRRMAEPNWTSLVQRMSNRHKGIGSDGVIVLCPASGGTGSSSARGVANSGVGSAHVRMRMFNADGSESEMCGNGIRCVAKFAHDRLGIRANPMLVETGRGVLSIAYKAGGGKVTSSTVDMGEPILTPTKIPVLLPQQYMEQPIVELPTAQFFSWPSPSTWTEACQLQPTMTCVSMGNPHVILWCDHVHSVPLRSIGPFVERLPIFPNRVNVHFVGKHTQVHTWERGAGITQACGTGACAVLVAGVLGNRLPRNALISVLGGELHIRWDEATNHVFMTGPAEDICEGEWLGDRP